MTVQDVDNRERSKLQILTFWISKNYPKVWADRTDIVLFFSFFLAVLFLGMSTGLKSLNLSLFMISSDWQFAIITIYWAVGLVACLAITAFWINAKLRSIHIEQAPNLSRINPVIRAGFLLMLIWGPYAYFYASFAAYIEFYYPGYSGFDLRFFRDAHPWFGWISLAIAMAVLAYTSTLYLHGATLAMGGVIITLVWYGALLVLGIIFAEYFFGSVSDFDLGSTYAVVLCVMIGMGALCRRRQGWSRIVFHAPAIYSATFGPWLIVAVLCYDEIDFRSTDETVVALFTVFLLNVVVLAGVVKIFPR